MANYRTDLNSPDKQYLQQLIIHKYQAQVKNSAVTL